MITFLYQQKQEFGQKLFLEVAALDTQNNENHTIILKPYKAIF